MTVSKNPTSYKLSLEVENGVNAIGAMQTKSASLGSVRSVSYTHLTLPTKA